METGLYYNRFRYYNPNEGMYISQDPIRLDGGLNLYSYVHDPNGWVDVSGLAHGMTGKVIRDGEVVHNQTYESGNGVGTGKLNQQEALKTHTERKFLNDIDPNIQPGDHLVMNGELNPCRPGCQSAIRDYVNANDITAEYTASSTGKKI